MLNSKGKRWKRWTLVAKIDEALLLQGLTPAGNRGDDNFAPFVRGYASVTVSIDKPFVIEMRPDGVSHTVICTFDFHGGVRNVSVAQGGAACRMILPL